MRREVDAELLRKAISAQQVATELYDTDPKPDWVTFFQQIMGVDGTIRQLFPDPIEVEQFHKTKEFRTIQELLGRLRAQHLDSATTAQATQMITPRLPKCLHRYLQVEVEELRQAGYKISLNSLVVMKLTMPIDVCMFPLPKNQ